MKLSLIAAASLAALSSLAVACSTTSDDPVLRKPPAATTPPAEAPVATPRKLVDGTALSTTPVNLIADPGFGLTGDEAGGYGSFLAFYEDGGGSGQFELAATLDSRSPAGFGGNVGLVKPEGASDTASAPVLVLAAFPGGAGPFRAQVWVSHSDVAGKPTEAVAVDDTGVRASVAEETPEGDAIDLSLVEGSTRTVGGRTWVLLRGEIQKPLTYGGFFIVRTGTGGGQFQVAAPEVVAQPLVDGLPTTKSRSVSAASKARSKTTFERAAIQKYKSRPPRLAPGAKKLRRGE